MIASGSGSSAATARISPTKSVNQRAVPPAKANAINAPPASASTFVSPHDPASTSSAGLSQTRPLVSKLRPVTYTSQPVDNGTSQLIRGLLDQVRTKMPKLQSSLTGGDGFTGGGSQANPIAVDLDDEVPPPPASDVPAPARPACEVINLLSDDEGPDSPEEPDGSERQRPVAAPRAKDEVIIISDDEGSPLSSHIENAAGSPVPTVNPDTTSRPAPSVAAQRSPPVAVHEAGHARTPTYLPGDDVATAQFNEVMETERDRAVTDMDMNGSSPDPPPIGDNVCVDDAIELEPATTDINMDHPRSISPSLVDAAAGSDDIIGSERGRPVAEKHADDSRSSSPLHLVEPLSRGIKVRRVAVSLATRVDDQAFAISSPSTSGSLPNSPVVPASSSGTPPVAMPSQLPAAARLQERAASTSGEETQRRKSVVTPGQPADSRPTHMDGLLPDLAAMAVSPPGKVRQAPGGLASVPPQSKSPSPQTEGSTPSVTGAPTTVGLLDERMPGQVLSETQVSPGSELSQAPAGFLLAPAADTEAARVGKNILAKYVKKSGAATLPSQKTSYSAPQERATGSATATAVESDRDTLGSAPCESPARTMLQDAGRQSVSGLPSAVPMLSLETGPAGTLVTSDTMSVGLTAPKTSRQKVPNRPDMAEVRKLLSESGSAKFRAAPSRPGTGLYPSALLASRVAKPASSINSPAELPSPAGSAPDELFAHVNEAATLPSTEGIHPLSWVPTPSAASTALPASVHPSSTVAPVAAEEGSDAETEAIPNTIGEKDDEDLEDNSQEYLRYPSIPPEEVSPSHISRKNPVQGHAMQDDSGSEGLHQQLEEMEVDALVGEFTASPIDVPAQDAPTAPVGTSSTETELYHAAAEVDGGHSGPVKTSPSTIAADIEEITHVVSMLSFEDQKRLLRPGPYKRVADVPKEIHPRLSKMSKRQLQMCRAYNTFQGMISEAERGTPAELIGIYNQVDDEPCPPFEFIYSNEMWYDADVPPPDYDHVKGCGCIGRCDPSSTTCSCLRRQEFWTGAEGENRYEGFSYTEQGRHKDATMPIFECNWRCGCDADCVNRVCVDSFL
jgi:hypothetical protein